MAEEQRLREEELNRLAKIEKEAAEESEGELARQAAELAEIARLESELAAKELEALQAQENSTANDNTAEPVVELPETPEKMPESPSIALCDGTVQSDEYQSPSADETVTEPEDNAN